MTIHPHRHEFRGLGDALGLRADPEVLEVEGDAEVLADDHARGDDLDLTAAVGEEFGHRRCMVESQFIQHKNRTSGVCRAGEDVAHVHDPFSIRWGPPGPCRHRSGCHHDTISSAFGNGFGIRLHAALDGHAEAFSLVQLVADQVAELGAVGNGRRQADLATGLRRLLQHGHAVSVAGRCDRCLESGRAGSDHEHIAGIVGRLRETHAE